MFYWQPKNVQGIKLAQWSIRQVGHLWQARAYFKQGSVHYPARYESDKDSQSVQEWTSIALQCCAHVNNGSRHSLISYVFVAWSSIIRIHARKFLTRLKGSYNFITLFVLCFFKNPGFHDILELIASCLPLLKEYNPPLFADDSPFYTSRMCVRVCAHILTLKCHEADRVKSLALYNF